MTEIAPATRPIPIPTKGAHAAKDTAEDNDTAIYDELVIELGDPTAVDEDYELAEEMHAESSEAFKKLIRDAYLQGVVNDKHGGSGLPH